MSQPNVDLKTKKNKNKKHDFEQINTQTAKNWLLALKKKTTKKKTKKTQKRSSLISGITEIKAIMLIWMWFERKRISLDDLY